MALIETAVLCLKENGRADAVQHTHADMFRQRIYGIEHLYEDCNDASTLRFGDKHKLSGKRT